MLCENRLFKNNLSRKTIEQFSRGKLLLCKYLNWFILKQINFGSGLKCQLQARKLRLFIYVNIISRIVGTVQGDYHPLVQVYVRRGRYQSTSLTGPYRGLSLLWHPVSPSRSIYPLRGENIRFNESLG
jgi:hypothetical protein